MCLGGTEASFDEKAVKAIKLGMSVPLRTCHGVFVVAERE